MIEVVIIQMNSTSWSLADMLMNGRRGKLT